MPTRPPRFRPGRSSAPVKRDWRQYDRNRESSHARGYGRRWREFRLWFLQQPGNVICATPGCNAPSTDVDHRIPVSGATDPRFWEADNLQGLCHACHSAKTRGDMQRGLTR